MVTDVMVGHSILHITGPRGQRGYVNFKTTSKGIQSIATVRSATARFTSRKLRVVRMRGVRAMTRQTKVFPITLTTKIVVNIVYCTAFSHLGWVSCASFVKLSFIEELLTIMMS